MNAKSAIRLAACAAFCAAAILAGCSHNESSDDDQPAPTATVDPATVGAISGTVTLDGTPPAPHPIIMTAGPECAKLHSSPLTYPEVVTGDNGALANVLVYVKSGLGRYRYDLPAAPATLDQVGCMYEPHVLGLMTHEKLDIKNTDPIVHNVHPVPHKNRAWNQSQPIGSAAIETEFDHPDFAIPVLCNLHPWMRAYVFVFSHPYFAVTTTAGTFDLKNLPPGTYTIEAWQEKYGAQDQTVTIGPNQSKAISFRFSTGG
ncbi:MAG: carboxypeptidase regulatory-like domain-containing protein [Candidatus Acidiferrales bacterium]